MVTSEHSTKFITIDKAETPKMLKNIFILDNAIDSNWCDLLLNKFEKTTSGHFNARVEPIGNDDREIVHLTKLYVSHQDESWDLEKYNMSEMMHLMFNQYKKYLKYPILSTGLPELKNEYMIELPTIKKYVAGTDDFIGPHSDTYMRKGKNEVLQGQSLKTWKGDRFLNILFYLNDVEEGGETQFYFDDCTITVPPRKGRIVMFPPLWTHIHAGLKPISGNKYICNGHLRAIHTDLTESNY